MTTVGFIGLGNMGRPMAANLTAAGIDLVCYDAAGTDERRPPGAKVAASAADVFVQADTVLLSVPDGAATASLVDAFVTVAAESNSRGPHAATVVDLSTIGPIAARDAASRLAPLGVTYCDGPVSGGAAGARAATISLMFAGPTEAFDHHRPVFAAMARNVFHVGLMPGQGQAMKLLNNYLSAVALAATSEALAYGMAEGLEMTTMLDVLNVSTGRNSATADKFPNRVVTGTYDAGFHTRLMTKDLTVFLESVSTANTSAEVARAVARVWIAADATMPGSDFTEIWKYVSGNEPAI